LIKLINYKYYNKIIYYYIYYIVTYLLSAPKVL